MRNLPTAVVLALLLAGAGCGQRDPAGDPEPEQQAKQAQAPLDDSLTNEAAEAARSTATLEQCMDRAVAMVQTGWCLEFERRRRQAELDAVSNQLLALAEPEGRRALAKAQKAWIAYRAADCDPSVVAPGGGSGTGHRAVRDRADRGAGGSPAARVGRGDLGRRRRRPLFDLRAGRGT